MKGKTVVITGANDGIGYHTALKLAGMGAAVTMVCRNKQKAADAIRQIQTATGNPNIHCVIADLSSQNSIRNAAQFLREKMDRIDVLLNNAGGTFSKFETTEDGFEKTIATNHFAYFLLTGLLIDLIKKSDYARIVSVSSDSHYKGNIDFESFKQEKNYSIFNSYRQSKLANVLFTVELAERLSGTHVTVNCLHPGTVRTGIANKTAKWVSIAWSLVTLFSDNAETGAKTSIYLASSDAVKGVTGKYFSKNKIVEPHPLAQDKAMRKKLWEISEACTGFRFAV